MPANVISVKPGETITVVGVAAEPVYPSQGPGFPTNPIAGWNPGTGTWPTPPGGGAPPIAGWPGGLPGGGGFPGQGGPVDPGYGVDIGHRPSHPIALPGDPWWGQDLKPTHPIVLPPIEPPTEPPPVEPPVDSGNWTWAWSPQLNRWVWVKVPGEGEAAPKEAA